MTEIDSRLCASVPLTRAYSSETIITMYRQQRTDFSRTYLISSDIFRLTFKIAAKHDLLYVHASAALASAAGCLPLHQPPHSPSTSILPPPCAGHLYLGGRGLTDA